MSALRPKSLNHIHNIADNLRGSMAEDEGSAATRRKEFSDVPYGNLQELYTELLERFRKAEEEKQDLADTAERRSAAYTRKEKQYEEQLTSLELQVKSVKDVKQGDERMNHIREVHGQILSSIGKVQVRTADILKSQEKELIRSFRARLADVTDELEKERRKNESGSVEWVARCKKLAEELEWLRDLTEKLTEENKNVQKENRRVRRQLKTQEDDREFLIKQLVAVKNENAKLRISYEKDKAAVSLELPELADALSFDRMGKMVRGASRPRSAAPSIRPSTSNSVRSDKGDKGFDSPGQQPGTQERRVIMEEEICITLPDFKPDASPIIHQPSSSINQPSSSNNQPSSSNNYASSSINYPSSSKADEHSLKAEILKIKKLLEAEIQKVRTVRTKHVELLARRAEAQAFMKQCVEDVRLDQKKRTSDDRVLRPSDPRNRFDTLSPTERISLMEWLLQQEQVLALIYERIFPRTSKTPSYAIEDEEALASFRG